MDKTETEQGNKDERIARKEKYAHAVLKSRLSSGNHTKEKERQHSTKERQKTLYGSYEIREGNADSFSNLDLLQVTAKHIKQKDIEAYYKTAEGKFIIVLLDSDLKETYAHELNFEEKICNNTVNFRILHNIPGPRISGGQNKNDPNTVFVTMFLPTQISNTAVKRVFNEFGEVHTVFAGTYKDAQFRSICNGKRHIRLTPARSKQELPHKIQFEEKGRFFHVMWAEKIIFCKHCGSHHMLKIRCSGERQNPVYKENVITYDTRPVYPDRDVVTESMGLGYPEVIQIASQVGSSLSNPDVANTHANVTSAIDPTVSQPGRSPQDAWHRNLGQAPWHKIQDRIPPASEDTLTASWGETDCPGRSRLTDVTSIVSANNAGAPRDCSGDLGQTECSWSSNS